MLVCRPRPHRLASPPFFSGLSTRSNSTTAEHADPSTSQPAESQDSIFTAPESPWDHVFSDVDHNPAQTVRLLRAGKSNTGAITPHGHKKYHDTPEPLMQRESSRRRQHARATMTAREMSVFDEMFSMIFDAMAARKQRRGSPASAAAGETPSIGRGPVCNDLFQTLRRHASRVRWTTAIDEELDRKKETMELFNTDHELLEWVMLELFEGTTQWDEEAKKAMAAGKDTFAPSTSTSDTPGKRPIDPSIYPHLIAHAMRVFRTTYSNPSLSLAVFNHAARVSIPSYVFGCTTPVYNELIEAKWDGWGDLEGVCSALEEMRANGIKADGKTHLVVEKVRREVGAARPGEGVSGERVNPRARRVWSALGEAEVMTLVHRVEKMSLPQRSKTAARPHEQSWKSAALQTGDDDGWRFNGWEAERRRVAQ